MKKVVFAMVFLLVASLPVHAALSVTEKTELVSAAQEDSLTLHKAGEELKDIWRLAKDASDRRSRALEALGDADKMYRKCLMRAVEAGRKLGKTSSEDLDMLGILHAVTNQASCVMNAAMVLGGAILFVEISPVEEFLLEQVLEAHLEAANAHFQVFSLLLFQAKHYPWVV